VKWTSDGWFHAEGSALSRPLPKPRGGRTSTAGFALSDDFSTQKLGVQWSFFNPGPDELRRVRFQDRSLVIKAKGSSAADCSPLTIIVGDRSYEASVILEPSGGTQAGLVLFYNERAFCGIGFSPEQMLTYNYAEEQRWMRQGVPTKSVHIKVTNRLNIVTFFYSHDGKNWTQHPWQMEVSGYQHNAFGGFLSLKVGIYCAGDGEVTVRRFDYKGLAS
jgi:xylan 1,4-beta-xylosidase